MERLRKTLSAVARKPSLPDAPPGAAFHQLVAPGGPAVRFLKLKPYV